jgi:hypothetical protein
MGGMLLKGTTRPPPRRRSGKKSNYEDKSLPRKSAIVCRHFSPSYPFLFSVLASQSAPVEKMFFSQTFTILCFYGS